MPLEKHVYTVTLCQVKSVIDGLKTCGDIASWRLAEVT